MRTFLPVARPPSRPSAPSPLLLSRRALSSPHYVSPMKSDLLVVEKRICYRAIASLLVSQRSEKNVPREPHHSSSFP